MTRYRAVFFDLFDTLVRFRSDQLPVIEIDGKTVRSTAGRLHTLLCAHVPALTLERCYGALFAGARIGARGSAMNCRCRQARFARPFCQ